MKIIRSICISLFFFAFLSLFAKEDFRTESQNIALEEARLIPNYGVLKQKENGFVYLDVSNEFITQIVPLLDHPGQLRARPTATNSLGAHISIFHENENITPKELGNVFSFDVQEIRSFTLHTRDGLKKLWIIAINSPELEVLRQNYGVESKLKGYNFHITLGKQMPKAHENSEKIEILSPLNFSSEPTSGLYKEGDFVTVENEDVLKTACKVDRVGQLKLKGNGYVYLDVDNRFIDEIALTLPLQGSMKTVSTQPKKMGAHISVILEDEMIGHEIWDLNQAGQWFNFEVKELRYIDRKGANGYERLWLLAVNSPGLERLRMQYDLKPKLKNHDFHITIGREALIPASLEKNTPLEVAELNAS